MVESRWVRRIGPGLVALLAVVAVATTTLGARDAAWKPPPCAGSVIGAADQPGTWWRMDPHLVDGALVGQRLVVGGPDLAGPRSLDLPAESFAAGPFASQVLVGSDDGKRSVLQFIDVARGCATTVGESADVIRRATLTPDRRSLIEFRVTRDARTDLGVFERPLSGRARPQQVLPPIEADAEFGPTWTTELAWSTDGRRLAVQSCGAVACRTRILDRVDGTVFRVAAPDLADMVGLAGTRLVVHGACGGLPCPLVAVDIVSGARVTLHPEAGLATITKRPDGRPAVVHEVGAEGNSLRSVGIDGSGAMTLPADPLGRRVMDAPARAGGAAEAGLDEVVLAPDGRLPLDGPTPAVLRRLAGGASLRFDEVSR